MADQEGPTPKKGLCTSATGAGRQARAGYAVRVEREAEAEPDLTLQAEAPDEAVIEL
jgi:hypothetical protein